MRIKVIGSGEYLRKGLNYLLSNGFYQSDDPELLVCLAHPEILKKEEIAKYAKGVINFHCGLPKYRGRHPLQWMLIEGVKTIPVAVHYIEEGIDTGPILADGHVHVYRDETYATALEKVTDCVGPLVVEAIRRIENGIAAKPQDASQFIKPVAKRTPDDSYIDLSWPSDRVHLFINAMASPMPNAFNGRMTFKRSYSGAVPGEVLAKCTDGRSVISTGSGVVLVDMA